MDPSLRILRESFGYESFLGFQKEVIDHVLAGGDALVLMPTGGGKSLCFQIPSLLRPGVGVVVSPLIALMEDQVSTLLQNGIRAAFLNSTQEPARVREVIQEARNGALDLLYMAPERLLMEHTLQLLREIPVALFAIDEAHCVSQWGHDFRPEYLGLALLAERFPNVPRLALTATADVATRAEIVERLRMEQARRFVAGFDRPNIRYRVEAKKQPRNQLKTFLQAEHAGDSGIVYCLSRKRVEETATWLCKEGFRALPYHAGMDKDSRRKNQEVFLKGEGVVMVATIAFGMGIDKPDVRFVAHLDLPKSMEAYYQETGRAGRDGLPANAFLTYGLEDVVMLRQFVENAPSEERIKRIERGKLEAILGYCETTTCRRQMLLTYFGETHGGNCNNCDTCLFPVQTWDGLQAAQKALSCVFRTGQRFGVTHLVDVLLGKEGERIKQFGHDQVSTYGIGKEMTAQQWRSVYRQLVARGFLTVDVEGFGGLRLSPSSRPVLRGEEAVRFRQDPTPPAGRDAKARVSRERAPRARVSFREPGDHDLFKKLRALRAEIADHQGVPPFVIFHDATLKEIVEARPGNLEELAQVHGIGSRKLDNYGSRLLDLLKAHGG